MTPSVRACSADCSCCQDERRACASRRASSPCRVGLQQWSPDQRARLPGTDDQNCSGTFFACVVHTTCPEDAVCSPVYAATQKFIQQQGAKDRCCMRHCRSSVSRSVSPTAQCTSSCRRAHRGTQLQCALRALWLADIGRSLDRLPCLIGRPVLKLCDPARAAGSHSFRHAGWITAP